MEAASTILSDGHESDARDKAKILSGDHLVVLLSTHVNCFGSVSRICTLSLPVETSSISNDPQRYDNMVAGTFLCLEIHGLTSRLHQLKLVIRISNR
jgi:hypothetical protein